MLLAIAGSSGGYDPLFMDNPWTTSRRALWGLATTTTFRDVEDIVEAQRQEFAGRTRHQEFDGIDRIDHTSRSVIPE